MRYTRQIPTYEAIRDIPVLELLQMNTFTLKRIEKEIRYELHRASIALKWVQGIKSIKNGGEDGE